MFKNIVEPDRPQLTTWRKHIEFWILKATNTHSEYVIFTACVPQQWIYESAIALHYTYIVCLV
jgi:hypothetical protein